MQQKSFGDYMKQYSHSDLTLFELMRSIADIHEYKHELSDLEIEQIQIGVRILNKIITRKVSPMNQLKAA